MSQSKIPKEKTVQISQSIPSLTKKDKFVYDDFVSQDFLQNKHRNPDLSLWERLLVFNNSQEVDDMRLLERIQPESELFRFKMDQYKDKSQSRKEMERVIQEHIIREVTFKAKKLEQNFN